MGRERRRAGILSGREWMDVQICSANANRQLARSGQGLPPSILHLNIMAFFRNQLGPI